MSTYGQFSGTAYQWESDKVSLKNMEDFPTYKEIREATAGCLSLQMKDDIICDVTVSKHSGIVPVHISC